jgi:hypothetical protein
MIWPRLISHTSAWALKNGDTFGLLSGVQVLAILGLKNAASASVRADVEVDLADDDCASAVARKRNRPGYSRINQGLRHWRDRLFGGDSLELRLGKVRERAWRSVEVA